MFAITWLNFLKKIIVHLEKGTKDLSDLEKFIDCVETIGNPTMVAFLKANLNSIYKE